MGIISSSTTNLNSNQISILPPQKEYYDYLEPYVNTGPQYIYPIGNTIIDLLDPTIDLNVEFFFYNGDPLTPNYISIYTDGTNWINYDTSNIEDNTVITQDYSIFVYFRLDLNLTTFPINSPFKVEKINASVGKLNQISPQNYIPNSKEYIRTFTFPGPQNLAKINSNYYSGIYPSSASLKLNEGWEYYSSPTNLSFTNPFPTGNGIPQLFWYNANPLSPIQLSFTNVAPNTLIRNNYTPSPIVGFFNVLVNDDVTFDSYLNSLGYTPATFKTDFANTYGITIDFSKHFLQLQARQTSSIPLLVNNLSGNFLNIRTDVGIVVPSFNNRFILNLFYKEIDIFNTVNLYVGSSSTTPIQQLFL